METSTSTVTSAVTFSPETQIAIDAVVAYHTCPLYIRNLERKSDDAERYLDTLPQEENFAAHKSIIERIDAYNEPIEALDGASAADMDQLMLTDN